ncbi:MAG: DNA-binding protein [Candidatus Aenigmarchaeota archaeon]|nr:DNA-binding protein [Candidatus Aenigmarchaeota archaeon]
MKIFDVKTTAQNVSIEGMLAIKGEPREVNTRMGATKVAECTIEDDSGTITLVLWGDQIDLVKEGDKIKISNGYVKEWNGALQLNVGKFGKIEVA